MKKLVTLILIIITFSNCTTLKNKNVIPYIVSIEVENSIYNKIKEKDMDKVAFYFEHLSDNKYKINLDGIDNRFSYSNRKLFINDRFYPIIFDDDFKFYVKTDNKGYPLISKFENEDEKKSFIIKMPNIDERFINKNLYLKDSKIYLNEQSIYWIIDGKGNLIETNSK